jgi:hypothetical protein
VIRDADDRMRGRGIDSASARRREGEAARLAARGIVVQIILRPMPRQPEHRIVARYRA